MPDSLTTPPVVSAKGAWPWGGIAGVMIATGAGLGAEVLGLAPGIAVPVILAAGGLGIGVMVWRARRRARAIASLEKAATGMLSADKPVRGRAAGLLDLEPDEVPEELRALARSMRGLGERFDGQLKAVAKNSRNLEALIAAMDEPLLATDNEDRVILCSRSTEAVLEGSGEPIIGRNIRDLFTSGELLDMHAAAKAGQTRRGRVRVMTPVGQRTFQVSASPVPAAWGEGVFGAVISLRDVTELDQAVQVKTDFVANASHELRTPVAAIRSAAETLEAAHDDPKMSERLRGMIVSHAERLEEMLRDLLDLSRLESPDVPLKIEHVDLDDVAKVLRSLSEIPCRERGLTLSFEFEDELRGLRTDRKLLTLILRNLVENATKFAHEQTTIRVIGTVVEHQVPSAGRASAPTPAVVKFEVIDRGVGIPLSHQERVFERYYQVDPARTGGGPAWKRGTGLGLAIVKHAAKALHGRVGLSSVWGQGTTVFVEVPVEIEPPEQGRATEGLRVG